MDKITAQTRAVKDQDHLPVILLSWPQVPDRTGWLADPSLPDPAPVIAEGLLTLERAGAGVAAMACNTAHTPAIFDRVRSQLESAGAGLRIFHLIEETVLGIARQLPEIRKVGILGTHGTLSSGLYHHVLDEHGFETFSPSDTNRLSNAIYSPNTGIKAFSNPVTETARQEVLSATRELIDRGAEAVILGCTELPLAVPEPEWNGIPLIDPASMLTRSLIRAVAPDRLG